MLDLTTILDAASAVLGLLAVFINSRGNSLWGWPIGAVSVSLYGYLAWQNHLYGQALLQVGFLVLVIYGFWQWRQNRGEGGNIHPKDITWPVAGGFAAGTLVAAVGVYALILQLDNPQHPLLDAAVTAASLCAQLLQARQYIANWWVWAAVNPASAWLTWQQDLYFYSGLYAVLTVMAFYGFFQWRKIQTQHS